MRMTESRLRSIIRNIIVETVMVGEDFNKRYGDLMLEAGSDHYDISLDYVRSVDHYEMIRNARLTEDDKFKAAKIFQNIGCECKYFDGLWFTNNAKNIIICLQKTDNETRKAFFGEMDALLHH